MWVRTERGSYINLHYCESLEVTQHGDHWVLEAHPVSPASARGLGSVPKTVALHTFSSHDEAQAKLDEVMQAA